MNGSASVSYAEMLVLIASGDRQAFRALYAQVGPKLFAICLRMMKARDQAEDVFQEAFIKIWERSWQFDPARGEALAWLATLTRHCALDRLRKAPKRDVAFDESIVEEIDLNHYHESVTAGDGGDLRRCLGGLRKDYRDAVVLAYVNGMTHEELASQLNKPVGTIKSWVRRGLEQLRECMDG